MSNEIITGEYRDINTITQAFRLTLAQAQRMALSYVVQLGQLITEAKELLDDSAEFERWLAEEVNFKKTAAYNYMKIAKEYGGDQVNLFGEVKNSRMSGLNYSQALALLAIPADEREEFAEANKVEDMSARELKKAIAERDEAIKAKEAAVSGKKAAEKALEAEKASRPDVTALENQVKTAKENSTRVEKSLEEAQKQLEKVQKQLADETEKQVKTAEELERLKKNPIIPDEVLGKLSKEAKEKAEKEMRAKVDELEEAKSIAEAQSEKLRKQLQQSNEEVTIFRTYLTDVQTTLNKLSGIIMKIDERDKELAAKLRTAEKSILSAYESKL